MSSSTEEQKAVQTQSQTKPGDGKIAGDLDTITDKTQTLHLLKAKGLTLTILFQGSSLNYGEGFGNYSELKKLNRYNGLVYSFSSRQSIRYSIFVQGVKEFDWKPSEVRPAGSDISSNDGSTTANGEIVQNNAGTPPPTGERTSAFGKKSVTQLLSTIVASHETDLFGYFDTNIKLYDFEETAKRRVEGHIPKKAPKAVEAIVYRTSPVRISPAISQEPYHGDTEMLTNKYQGDKIQAQPNIATSEIHQSIYCYTISIDLHRVGTEQDEICTRMGFGGGKDNPKSSETFQTFQDKIRSQRIPYDQRKQRVLQLLDIISRLYRDIRGRREDLKPLFIVGGVYNVCNPYFSNIVSIDNNKFGEKDFQPRIKPEPIVQLLKDARYMLYGINGNGKTTTVRKDTFVGIRDGFFNNKMDEFIKGFPDSHHHVGSPEFAIFNIKKRVEQYYDTELPEVEKMINEHAVATN